MRSARARSLRLQHRQLRMKILKRRMLFVALAVRTGPDRKTRGVRTEASQHRFEHRQQRGYAPGQKGLFASVSAGKIILTFI